MRLDNVFTLLYHDLPMVVRLRCGDRWILGGEDSWVSYKKISDVSEKGTISVNEYVTYTFEWKWPLENEADGDTNDTDIVEYAPYQDVSFKLSIDTQCEMTPGAVPMDGNGNELANPLTPTKTARLWFKASTATR